MSFVHEKELAYLKNLPLDKGIFQNEVFQETSEYEPLNLLIVNKVNFSKMLGPAKNIQKQMVFLGLIVLVISGFIYYLFSYSVTKSIRKMISTISSLENLDKLKYISENGNYEVTQLAKVYNEMIDRIAQAAKQEKERQVQIKQYELTLLQEQINPHFLNNILENACGLMELDRKEDSVSLIMDTANFYRLILSGGDIIIPLSQELSIAETYIKIQNVRYNGKIDFAINIPESLLHRKIVKLTLQPLLENAIRHGLRYKKGEWKI